MRVYLVNLKFKDRNMIHAILYTYLCIAICIARCISADGWILWQAQLMFYSSPWLPDWPKQRQILWKRANIPICLIGSHQMISIIRMSCQKICLLHSGLLNGLLNADKLWRTTALIYDGYRQYYTRKFWLVLRNCHLVIIFVKTMFDFLKVCLFWGLPVYQIWSGNKARLSRPDCLLGRWEYR